MIAFNTTGDYQMYTADMQTRFGRFADYRNNNTADANNTTASGWLVPILARTVDVARFKYRDQAPDSIPVWSVIRASGYLPDQGESPRRLEGFRGVWGDDLRPPTPEEITAQCWLSLNCGVQGLIFQDAAWDGSNLGIVDWRIGTGRVHHPNHSRPSPGEYDSASANHPSGMLQVNDSTWIPDPKWTLDSMWLGFRSRFDAVKRISHEFRKLDSIVYSKLEYRQEQISLHDVPRQSITSIPMLTVARAEKAIRDSVTPTGYASPHYDTPDSAYLEITHFWPGARDSIHAKRNARYHLYTNRRTWPTDFKTYYAKAISKGANASGLGRIDTRRPVVVFANATDVIADRLIVEQVGNELATRDTVNVGDTVRLGWLEPGWGALYRVIPIPLGVSNGGTAYNNAVRSENPSTEDSVFDRLVVYERDSIVYLRALDSSGSWSSEWRVSAAADMEDTDTSTAGWQRRASNFHPAVATSRTGNSAMVTWERWDHTTSRASVEALWIDGRPRTAKSSLGDSIVIHVTPPRVRASSADTLGLAPSIVGISGGYVIAFPSANDVGTSVFVTRDQPYGLLVPVTSTDTTSAHHICWNCGSAPIGPLIDSVTSFPTLAYFKNQVELPMIEEWEWRGDGAMDTVRPGQPLEGQVVHLAYQQGSRTVANQQHIMYNMLGVRFRDDSSRPAAIWVSPTEHVTAKLPGCGFFHPSIAADAMSTGIAFQAHSWNHRRVVLRFRDSTSVTPRRKWTTPSYAWHDNNGQYFEWPSLTQFPEMPLSNAEYFRGPVGAITWFRTNGANAKAQYFYRFGNAGFDRIADGQYPTMTLVSQLMSDPLSQSGIFHRGDTTQRSVGPRPYSTTGSYYPAYMINTPGALSDLFFADQWGTIIHGIDLRQVFERTCNGPAVRARDLRVGIVSSPTVSPTGAPIPVTGKPGLPPTFFPKPTMFPIVTETVDQGLTVARTSEFLAPSQPVSIVRHLSRSSDYLDWLNSEPVDSLKRPGNVWVVTELVRVSDNAVLWSDDTISMRGLLTDTLEETVWVPVDTVAAPQTPVYIRLRVETTPMTDCDVSTFFDWTSRSMVAMPRPRFREGHGATTGATGALDVAIVPNPVTDVAQIRLQSSMSGRVLIDVFDGLGTIVQRLEPVSMASGHAEVPLDLSALPAGTYSLRAAMNGEIEVTQFTVVR